MTSMDRRAFLARGAAAGGGVALTSLTNRLALADMRTTFRSSYGAPVRAVDQLGRNILALPPDFSYVTFGEIGSPMSDGAPTPLALDGMAAFRGPCGTVRLIRNHEDRNPIGAGSVKADAAAKYDPQAGAGTVTLDYDQRTRTLVRSFVSLAGTTVNCAGGHGLHHRSWLSGEETIVGPEATAVAARYPQRHGYMFEVPVDRTLGDAPRSEPLTAMGRFSHEAAATDQRTGVVYMTEDPGGGRGAGFFRYIPDDPWKLAAGGRLQMLSITDLPNYDAREGQTAGKRLDVTWIDIADPDPPYRNLADERGVFEQGWALGAAKFNRLEGCWWSHGSVFFVSTSGGDVKNGDVNADGFHEGFGQVWEYRRGTLTLHYESPGGEVLDSPDNLTVTPRGGLLMAEDDASSAVDTDPTAPGLENINRLIGISPRGEAFVFAVNTLSTAELAGVCFSPDGRTLFVNIYGLSTGTPEQRAGAGMTCAITGPWRKGPL
jgi:secreted PhoX family phosphatase